MDVSPWQRPIERPDIRISPHRVPVEGRKLVRDLQRYLRRKLSTELRTLVALLVAQMHGCEDVTELHLAIAEHHGITPTAIANLRVWHDSPLFSARERAVFAWAEVVTDVCRDARYETALEAMRRHYSDEEVFDYTLLVGEVNLRVRVALAMRDGATLGPSF